MPRKMRVGSKVLKAVSSPLRLEILRLLSDRGPLTYTDIMNILKLSPSRDAGRFAYHLKTLLNMDLMEPDVESKRYGLTTLGKALVEFADQLDENAYRKKLLVRSSRLAIESFDGDKISESLVREADVPIDLAQKIAKETEKRLLKIDTKYLTAPLIREFVNAVLIERGLEEYRHKLTRLGFPVYDVSQLIKNMSNRSADVGTIHEAAGNRVMEEYTLLNVLPRDVADGHLSGSLNLNNLSLWVLKTKAVMHDLRFFLKYGLRSNYSQQIPMPPPKTFRAALSMIIDVLRLSISEVSSEQGIDFFNCFLAPYIRSLPREEVKEEFRLFLTSLNLTIPTTVSLGIETVLPSFLADCRVPESSGLTSGVYGDYVEESRLIASLVLECMKESVSSKPIFNPCPIVKVRSTTINDNEVESLLYEAHALAAEGLPYFANLSSKEQSYASYTATGLRFAADWKEDWELDTIRTGAIESVTINLPRALYDAGKDRRRFFENLFDLSEKAMRALEIKYLTMRLRAREGLLPFLVQRGEQDPYMRLENSTKLVSFVGLNETVVSMTGKQVHENHGALAFAEETVSHLSKLVKAHAKKQKGRFALSMTPDFDAARRLAELDIERYGLAEVHIQSGKEKPCYTNLTVAPYPTDIPLGKRLSIEERFHSASWGSHLAKIPLKASEDDVENLLSTTKEIVSNYKIGLYAFDRDLTHCNKCQKTFHGDQNKCPICGSVNTLTWFSREPATYTAKRS